MTIFVLVRRFLADYARNPVNLLLLAVVPVVFVIVVAGRLADAARLLAGPGGATVETASAGWAAAFLAGIAMYFQTAATRDTDRRLVIAGLPAARLVAGRLLTGLVLAVMAAAVAQSALAIRTGLDAPARVIAGTLMFAVIYVAIGAVVGTLVRNPVNGTVIILFIWILDVFFGPAMGAADRWATRPLPTHFVTLWMVDLPSGHGGRVGDLGWGLLWMTAAIAVAWTVTVARTRRSRTHAPARPGRARTQLMGACLGAWRDARRNPALWVLFVVVPLVFIWTADAVTPDEPISLRVTEDGHAADAVFRMPDVHGATMAPIAVASLAALVGLFTMVDARDGDRRAALAGMRTGALLGARLTVLSGAALAAAAISLAATAAVFDAVRWPVYVFANVLLALTYALVGALLAPLFGRIGGVFLAFLLPFLDIGISQSPMLQPEPGSGARLLPGFGGSRVLLDAALTPGFDEVGPLWAGVVWLAVLALFVTITYRRSVAPARPAVIRREELP
ncbi:MAG: ABC transporter permease [Hamadaea sp.]|nr:ABC transporter permease [Hamadaea sp.]